MVIHILERWKNSLFTDLNIYFPQSCCLFSSWLLCFNFLHAVYVWRCMSLLLSLGFYQNYLEGLTILFSNIVNQLYYDKIKFKIYWQLSLIAKDSDSIRFACVLSWGYFFFLIFIYLFLATSCKIWCLNSCTRDWTHAHCIGWQPKINK